MYIEMHPHIGPTASRISHLSSDSLLRNAGKVSTAESPYLYPRLTSHSDIMERTAAIADNLDEVLMLPPSYIFPLKGLRYRQMRRRVLKAEGKGTSLNLKRRQDQEEFYEEYEEYNNK